MNLVVERETASELKIELKPGGLVSPDGDTKEEIANHVLRLVAWLES